MKNSRTTEGATLVLTVLIVLLMLASIVVVTGQLALSARRNSNDQESTLQAQYAAESGVARAQARMNAVNALMSGNLKPAAATTTPQMLLQMANLCGISTPTAAMSNLTGVTAANPLTLCSSSNVLSGFTPTTLAVAGVINLNFFTGNIDNASYAANGYTLSGDQTAAERQFWAESLLPGGVTLNGTVNDKTVSGTSGLTLTKVQRTGVDSYRLTFNVPDVTVSGASSDQSVSRKLAVSGVAREYTYEISRGSFAKYALFTDHHFADQASEDACAANASNCNRVTFTSNTLFSGPVHSNQNFLMQGTPYFAGQVTSAGCPPGKIVTNNGVESCNATATPGAYFQSTKLVAPGSMSPSSSAPVACSVTTVPCPPTNIINPQFAGGVNWNAGFQPLPQNANSQANAAIGLNADGSAKGDTGLLLNGNVDAIDFAVGSITPSGSSTATPAQFINYKMSGSATTVQLAVDANKTMYIKVGTAWKPAVQVGGVWIDASLPAAAGVTVQPFNGVIYTNGVVTSVKGPARTTASDPNTAAPAVASFSQMTLAATGTIHIKGDLKYQNPPCNGSNSVSGTTFTAAPCPNTSEKNILGLYSSGGDVAIDSPAKYGAANGVGKDVTIQAVLMASQGRITVDGYDQGTADGSLGQVKLLGGIIEKYYGPFGITDGRGFGRNFVYDPRTGDGLAPPSFPTQSSWETAFKLTSASGASTPTPLKLDGSYRQTN
ncbi:DUF4900 domain-containing protein [Deinococcus aquiradiocola]|nr:DUF4900 domain-containing protein [Deinococcus aquiradiocola]